MTNDEKKNPKYCFRATKNIYVWYIFSVQSLLEGVAKSQFWTPTAHHGPVCRVKLEK